MKKKPRNIEYTYICEVCGETFDDEERANRHENACINDVIHFFNRILILFPHLIPHIIEFIHSHGVKDKAPYIPLIYTENNNRVVIYPTVFDFSDPKNNTIDMYIINENPREYDLRASVNIETLFLLLAGVNQINNTVEE